MKILIRLALFAVCMTSYAGNDLSIDVKVTEPKFVVSLPANPTTGFQWTLVHYDKKLFTLKSSQYIRPETNLVGAGGQMHFNFLLRESKNYPSQSELVFKYGRSWEPKSAQVKKVIVQLHAIN